VFAAGVVTISNNNFTHVAGQPESAFASILAMSGAENVTINNNTIHSCGPVCYKILDGSTVSIRNDNVTVLAGHGTINVLRGGDDDPASPNNVITFENNAVTGAGEALVMRLTASDATVNGNTFTQFSDGVHVSGVGVDAATLTGQDNIFELTGTAFTIEEDGFADFRFNDFTGQTTDIGDGGNGTSILTCNYWGNPGGPQVFPPGLEGIFTPFATSLIARTGAVGC